MTRASVHRDHGAFERALGKKVMSEERFSSGMSGEVRGLVCSDGTRFVSKAYPGGKERAQTLLREWQGLVELHAAGIKVPEPVFLDESSDDPVLFMEWIDGRTFIDAWPSWDAAAKKRQAEALLDLADAVHEAPCPRLLSGGPIDTASFVSSELAESSTALGRLGQDGMLPLIDWLAGEMKALNSLPQGMVIRDLHPWNVLVDDCERLFLIDLDWAVGDPRFDLAWMLNTLEMGNRADISETLVHSMEARRESAAGGIGFFRLLARLRWLIGVLDSFERLGKDADRKMISPFLRRVLSLIVDETGLDLSLEGA